MLVASGAAVLVFLVVIVAGTGYGMKPLGSLKAAAVIAREGRALAVGPVGT